jgi:hypothetical protein
LECITHQEACDWLVSNSDDDVMNGIPHELFSAVQEKTAQINVIIKAQQIWNYQVLSCHPIITHISKQRYCSDIINTHTNLEKSITGNHTTPPHPKKKKMDKAA